MTKETLKLNNVKRSVIILLIAVLAVVGIAVANAANGGKEKTMRYENSKYHFSLDYPSIWGDFKEIKDKGQFKEALQTDEISYGMGKGQVQGKASIGIGQKQQQYVKQASFKEHKSDNGVKVYLSVGPTSKEYITSIFYFETKDNGVMVFMPTVANKGEELSNTDRQTYDNMVQDIIKSVKVTD